MKLAHALLALSLLAASAWAQDPPAPVCPCPAPCPCTTAEEPKLELPAEIKVEVGDFIVVPAKTNGRLVKWRAEGTGHSPLPDILVDKEVRKTTWVAVAKAPGVVTLHAATALGGVPSDIATCVITIGTPVPPNPPAPAPLPVDVPSPELQAIVAPLRAIVQRSDRAAAAKLATLWSSFSLAVKGGAVPGATHAEFRAGMSAYLVATATDLQIGGAFPGYTAALDAALDAYFGTAGGPRDSAKEAAFASALLWAARG